MRKNATIIGCYIKYPIICSVAALLVIGLSGCSIVEFSQKDTIPYNTDIMSGYLRTGLKISSSADVIEEMGLPEYELFSQTKSAVASAGQSKDGNKKWFKMTVFGETGPNAQRKYILIADERPRTLMASPRASAIFECQTILDKELASKPYSSESAKLVAVLQQIKDNALKDFKEVNKDNNVLAVCTGIANQALSAALTHMQASPAAAAKLNSVEGVPFSNMSFNKGLIQMGIEYDLVTVKIQMGSIVEKLKITREKDLETIETEAW